MYDKINALIAVVELTDLQVGLDTLKELRAEISANEITMKELVDTAKKWDDLQEMYWANHEKCESGEMEDGQFVQEIIDYLG